MEVLPKIWTYSELSAEFPSEQRIELINNRLFMPPAPSPEHQIISKKTFKELDGFVENKQLGQTFYAPIDVILDEYTVVQPDILFISNARLKHLTKRGFEGVPDLVVEIISPSTFYRDSHEKFGLYERVG
ncbi:MAG: Uma2 family endonuclease, partial [Flammeovirgaceae bacterium]|nr:Uma2 family endonuclease [Flammeovirgaceae bacterium]